MQRRALFSLLVGMLRSVSAAQAQNLFGDPRDTPISPRELRQEQERMEDMNRRAYDAQQRAIDEEWREYRRQTPTPYQPLPCAYGVRDCR